MTSPMPTWPDQPSSNRGRGRWLLLVAMLAVAGAAAWWRWRSADASSVTTGGPPVSRGAALGDTSARAPEGTRIVVRVVNSTSIRGLARRATFVLRDFGYDVVDFDSSPKDARETTRIEVHTGQSAWGERVRRVLGVGVVTARPDSSRYVDLTVFIGRDWQPPAEPLRP